MSAKVLQLVIPGRCGFIAGEPGIGFAIPCEHKTDSGLRPQKVRAAPE
jgi:hypothetical protein